MALKIICLEEHLADDGLAKATKAALHRQAPYQADLGSSFREDLGAEPHDRPRLVAPQTALELVDRPMEKRLAAMDRDAIDVQVLSYSNAAQFAPPEIVRAANDRMARITAEHPSRFAAFSALPWQDVDAAVRETDRTATELGMTATMLIGRPGSDSFLDDPRYEPVLAKLEACQVALYVHPGPPLPDVQRPYYGGLNKEVVARLSLYGWGWHNEAGVQVVRLILSGALDRHPRLRIISGHWGEMVPFFLQRLDDALPKGATGLQRTMTETYRDQVYVTPSGMLYGPHFQFCRETLGVDRILFAVDYPYLTMSGARNWLETLPVSDAERHAIAHGNAERLLRSALARPA